MWAKLLRFTFKGIVESVLHGVSSCADWHPVLGWRDRQPLAISYERRLPGPAFVAPAGGAAHLFRHGLATRMIRHGASITEIAEVLRHRSQITTAAYSQVAFEALRGVAQPWPAMGGIR